MALDDFSKQILKNQFEDGVLSEVKVGHFEKSFDFLILGQHEKIKSSDLIPALFKTFEYNIVEYKSHLDIYTHSDILKLIGDFAYFCSQRGISVQKSLDSCCLWFLISDPTNFLDKIEDFGVIIKEKQPGYYQLDKYLPLLRILVLQQLDVSKRENALLLHMAGPEKYCEFLTANSDNDELIQRLRKYINKKLLMEGRRVKNTQEVQKVKSKIEYYVKDNIRDAIEDLGLPKVIEAVGFNRVISVVGLQRVVDELGVKRVVDELGVKRVVDELGVKRVVDELGVKKLIQEVGLDKFADSLDAKEKEYLLRKLQSNK